MESAAKPTRGNSRTLLRLARLLWFWNSSCNWGSSLFEWRGERLFRATRGGPWVRCYGTWDAPATSRRIAKRQPVLQRVTCAIINTLCKLIVCLPSLIQLQSLPYQRAAKGKTTTWTKITYRQHFLRSRCSGLKGWWVGINNTIEVYIYITLSSLFPLTSLLRTVVMNLARDPRQSSWERFPEGVKVLP